jgi:hypothetical protein
MFVGKARSLPLSGALERDFIVLGSGLTKNTRLDWKILPKTDPLAYYKIHNLRTKKFCKLGPWWQCYKKIYGLKLHLFIIS